MGAAGAGVVAGGADGALLPDPADAHCPAAFKGEARRILLRHEGRPSGWSRAVEADDGLRRVLLKFVADFANWDVAAHPAWLATARALVKAAHGEEPPLVVDPFAGGGSVPLEALRLGCEAFASDLNPVACLILKVMLEDISRHGPKLAEELRQAGREIKAAAEKELKDLYPADPDGATPIAYLWARTVRCEAPDCGEDVHAAGPLGRRAPRRARAVRRDGPLAGDALMAREPIVLDQSPILDHRKRPMRRTLGLEQGIEQGVREGQRALLRRQAAARFGAATAERLFARLRQEESPERLAEVGEAIVRCETGEDLLRSAGA